MCISSCLSALNVYKLLKPKYPVPVTLKTQNFMENQQENLNQNDELGQEETVDPTSLATDGPVSQNEGDGGADLNETGISNDLADDDEDFEITPDDDEATNVDEEDLDALEGDEVDDDGTLS